MKDRDDIRHVGDEVCFAGNEGFDLRQKRLIEISLGLGLGFDEIKDFSDLEFAVEMRVSIGIKGGKLFVPRLFGRFVFRKAFLPLCGEGEVFGCGEFGVQGCAFDGMSFALCGFHEFAIACCPFCPWPLMHLHGVHLVVFAATFTIARDETFAFCLTCFARV